MRRNLRTMPLSLLGSSATWLPFRRRLAFVEPRPAGSRTAIAAALVLASLALPGPVGATPSYGRRYNVSCNTCHAPLPPRLNNVGMLFRRLGFRMPDADDVGKLIIKTVPAQGIGDAASLSGNAAFRRDQEAEEGTNKATLQLGEVELVAGTAIGNHLSTQAMFVPWNEEGEVELEDFEGQFNAGSPRHQMTARAGLMQTFFWQKANHGALTQSSPLLFDGGAVQGVGDFGGFGLGTKLIGAEAGYLFTSLKDGRFSSTAASVAVYNGVNSEGARATRNTTSGADVLLQATQLFGQRNTLGAFYYRGRVGLAPATPAGEPKDRFTRYGLMGSYALFPRFDVVAGVAQGSDRTTPAAGETRMRGLYTELVATLTKRWIGVYRFDTVDPDRDTDGDTVRAHTLSSTFQADEHLYLTAEYQWLRRFEEKGGAFIVNARLIY